jgi:hypothetical protein
MSYVLQIWELPHDRRWPTTVREATALVMELHGPTPGQNPKFLEFAKRLTARYPCVTAPADAPHASMAAWIDGPLDGITDEAVYGIGLEIDLIDEVRPFVISTAIALGLCVEDEQAGEYFLANGSVLSIDVELRRRAAASAVETGNEPKAKLPSREELTEHIIAEIGPVLEHDGFARAPEHDGRGGIYLVTAYAKTTPSGWHRLEITAVSDGQKSCKFHLDWICSHKASSDLRNRIKYDGNVPADAVDFGFSLLRQHRWIDDRDGLLTPDGPDGTERKYFVPSRDDLARCTRHLVLQIEKRLLPMIAAFEDLTTLDRLVNPDPVTASPFFVRYESGAYHIAVAYLAGNPRLSALCAEFFEKSQAETMFMEGQRKHLHKCIAYMRTFIA